MNNKVIIDTTLCKGCQLCVSVCPKKVLAINTGEINNKGYSPCFIKNNEDCISCAMCGIICPDSAITVTR